MPPLPNVPQVVKLTIGGAYHDTRWLNIWYVHYTGTAPSAAQLATYLTNVDLGMSPLYAAEMSVDNSVDTYTATDLSSATGAENAISVSHFGVRTGDFVPANVCMVASMEIARRYRGGHPRKYLPWGTAGTYATGSTKDWDGAFVTDCQSKINSCLSAMHGTFGGGPTFDETVNVSYRNAGAVRPAAVVDVITSAVIRTRICSQRRRLGRVGG